MLTFTEFFRYTPRTDRYDTQGSSGVSACGERA